MGCMKSSTPTSPAYPPLLFSHIFILYHDCRYYPRRLTPCNFPSALTLISSDPSFATVASNADTLTVASEWAKSLQLAAGLLPSN